MNCVNSIGETPLHKATAKDLAVFSKLINHPDVDVNCVDDIGETPLHKASMTTRVRELLNHPCILINQKNGNKKTPFDKFKESKESSEFWGQDRSTEYIKIMGLIVEFPIKRRWDAYQYF